MGALLTRVGVFATTTVAFFRAEMGDKTQIATVMLAARYNAYLWVVAGTTLGMMLANVPVVWLGERMTRLIPLRTAHIVSATIFAVLGVVAPHHTADPRPAASCAAAFWVDILAERRFATACGRVISSAKDASQPGHALSY
jgi:hypothetical protein